MKSLKHREVGLNQSQSSSNAA